MITEVGNKVQEATVQYEHQSEMETLMQNYRESVSGVSLDEEMVNLVTFQHAYEAAAKMITTVDEMMQTIIQMV